MKTTTRQWAYLLLWPNFAVATVVLVLVAVDRISTIRDLLTIAGYALTYSNLVALVGILLFTLARRASAESQRGLRLVPALAFCVAVVVPLGCLIVQALLMVIGVVVPQHFWREYWSNLRVTVPLAAVFGLGALSHASRQERLSAAEQRLHEKEVAEERTRKLLVEARLRSLESRIRPHFLFNTLNSIGSLTAVDPVHADRIVGRLAALLRASLDTSDRPLIPLREEIAMVESYLDIERARFGDRLRGSVEVPAELLEARVPPMAVQALVENAVKHGITRQAEGGEVRVSASADDGTLRIEVRDSGPGFDLRVVPQGHGLESLVGRLDALFGEAARLDVSRRDEDCVVEMCLPRV
jgi:sensor histidine kinase YesM